MISLTIWVSGFMTLAMFSFLWRDNPLFRFAEHLFIGVTAGYYFAAIYMHQVLKPNFFGRLWPAVFGPAGTTAEPQYLLIIPGILGLLMLLRLSKRWSWLSRYSVAFVVGAMSGLALVVLVQEQLLPQMRKAIVPLWLPGDPWGSFSNAVLLIGTVTCLLYFFFGVESRTGWYRPVAAIGRGFLMVSFGALFGATIMGRISLLVGRMQFFLHEFAPAVGAFPWGLLIMTALISFLLFSHRSGNKEAPKP
jgi:hypothetical protein